MEADATEGTIPPLHPAQLEAYRRMDAAAKLTLAMELRDAAWELKKAYLRELHPDWSELQLHEAVREIFTRAGD